MLGADVLPIVMDPQTRANPLANMIESKEREILFNSKSTQSEIDKAYHQHTKKEYNLLKECMPHRLLRDQEYFDQKYEEMKQNMVEFDPNDKSANVDSK